MSFRSVFIALVNGFGLVLAGYLINSRRPRIETDQPSADFVRASGKCAECHTRQQHSIVHEYELSVHAKKGHHLSRLPSACRRRVASATWARITRKWRSTTSRNTGSCSPPRSTC